MRSRLRRLRADLAELAAWTPGVPLGGPAFATAQRLRQVQLDRARPGQAELQSNAGKIAATRAGEAARREQAIREEQEQAWQRWVTANRQQDPAAAPPAKPGLTLADAYAELQKQMDATVMEAARAYHLPGDRQGHLGYVRFHAEQARERTLTVLRADLGIGVSTHGLMNQLAVAAPIDPARLTPDPNALGPTAAEAWVAQQETAAVARALRDYPGETGSEPHLAYIAFRAGQARERALSAISAPRPVTADAREHVLTEVLRYGRAWQQPVAEVAAGEKEIRDQAAADVSQWRAAAAAGDIEAAAKLAYWRALAQDAAGVAGEADRSRERNQKVAEAAVQAEMEQASGDPLSARVKSQFAAEAVAFGWVGYARAWMDLKQAAHERASAAAKNVVAEASQAAYQAYEQALSNLPATSGTSEPARARDEAAGDIREGVDQTEAGQAAIAAAAQYAKGVAQSLPAADGLPEAVGAAVLADRIWDAVAATQTGDAAGILSRAASLAGALDTGDAPDALSGMLGASSLADPATIAAGGQGTPSVDAPAPAASSSADPTRPSSPQEQDEPGTPALPREVTWLRASRDRIAHLQAALSAPRVTGFKTLMAHIDGGAVLDGDTPLSAEQIAVRLGLPVVRHSLGGSAPVPSHDPATVLMLVCNADGGLVTYDDSGDQDPGVDKSVPSPAGGLHKVTGLRVAAPRGEAILLPNGEVIAGTWKPGNPNPVPEANGDWVVWENGVARSLGTPFLREALASLGAELLPTDPDNLPSAPVGFYNGPTSEQTAALDALGYRVAEDVATDGTDGPDTAYSFYQALITVARGALRGTQGQPVPQQIHQIHQMVVDEFARDIRQPNSRYRDLIAGSSTPEQALAELKRPAGWGRQAAHLAPYVAADLFGIELGVLGPAGAILPVTDESGPRVRDQHGLPFLLVRVGDRHFAPAVPLPAASRLVPAAAPANPWTAELSPEASRLAAQEGSTAPLLPGAGEPDAIGRVAEMNHLAPAGRQVWEVPRADEDRVRDGIRRLLARVETPAEFTDGERQAILDRFDALERVNEVVDSTRPRWRELRQEYLSAVERAEPGQDPVARRESEWAAIDAAYVRALGERAGAIRAARDAAPARRVPFKPGAGSIQTALADAHDEAMTAAQDAERRREDAGEAYRASVEASLQGMRDKILQLAGAELAVGRAAGFERLLGEAQRVATEAAAAAEAAAEDDESLRAHREAEADASVWQARRRVALEEVDRRVAERELPPGFGVDGVFPFGHQGRMVRVGNVPLTDTEGIARLIAGTLPPEHARDARMVARVGAGIQAFIRGRQGGRHLFTQRVLDQDGLTIDLGHGQKMVVKLSLDMDQVHHVRAIDTELTAVGLKRHHAVEADHEMQGGWRQKVEDERDITVSANVLTATGLPLRHPHIPVSTVAGGSITGSSSVSYTQGHDIVSGTKRAPRFKGETAYFDFRGATLQTTIREERQPDRANSQKLTVRLGFPIEVAPLKEDGDPPGAFRKVPRTLPGSRRYNVPPEADADSPMNHVLYTPEWAGGGLSGLREQVRAIMEREATWDQKVAEGVDFFLSETSVMRMISDILGGSGAISPELQDAKGKSRGHLIVTARLRGLQASTKSLLGVKEEAQRFINVEDSKAQGGAGSVSLSGNASKTFGDPQAEIGGFSNVGGQANVTATLSSERSHVATTGSGDIRGMVIWGNSILYLSDFEFNVQVVAPNAAPDAPETPAAAPGTTDAPDTPDARKTLFGDPPFLVGPEWRATGTVNMGMRIPELHQARFEARAGHAESGTPIAPGDLPADDWPHHDGKQDQPLHPPESMAANQGIGFAGVLYMQGAGRVLPELMRLAQAADHDLPWAKDWTPSDLAWLQAQLTPYFTREGLTTQASVLFQPTGIRVELWRPARSNFKQPGRSGWEVFTITLSASHGSKPSALGRVAEATLEVMPSAFAGQSGDDTIGAAVNATVGMNALLGLSVHKQPRGLGFLLQGAWARSVSETTTVGATGFSLQSMLYEGKARTINYNDVKFKAKVSVRHEKNVSPGWSNYLGEMGLGTAAGAVGAVENAIEAVSDAITSTLGTATLGVLKAATQKVAPRSRFMADLRAAEAQRAAVREFAASVAAAPASATVESELDGNEVQFIIHEKLARPTEPDAAALAEVGKTTVEAEFSSKRPWGGRPRKKNEVVLPPLKDFLAADGHVDPGADAQVMEVLTSELGGRVEGLLSKLGIHENTFGAMPWVLTEPAHLAGQAGGVRPGQIQHTFVKNGLYKDKHVTVRLEGVATNASQPNPDPVTLFQMHVAEGGPILAAQHGKGSLWGFDVGLPGMSWLFGGSKFSGQPGLTYGRGQIKNSSRMTNMTETAGRLTQGTRAYLETTTDMVWRITVTAQDKNLAHNGPVEYAGEIVKVKNGMSFLRLERPAVDPRGRVPEPADPNIVRVLGRRPPGAGPQAPDQTAAGKRTRLVRQVRATNREGDDRMVPLVGLPATAVTDRLYPTKASLLEAPGDPPPGEDNPLLKAVQSLLSEQAPELLEANWTVEGDSRRKQVPARLQNVLNLQSLTMMIDLVLGPGLVLHAIRSVPGGSERVQIVLQGRRDPHNRGYVYLESVTGNSVRYATRLGIENESWSSTASSGFGMGDQQPGAPTAQVSTGPSGGVGQGTAASGEREGVLSDFHLNPAGTFTQSTGTGGYKQTMAAQRDTLFVPGPPTKKHHRYGGDLQIKLSLTKTPWDPSRLVNMIGLNAPHYAASYLQDAANTRREGPTKTVDLAERVLVPHQLVHHETVPEGPTGDIAAVEEMSPFTVLGKRLDITGADLLSRTVLSLGFDPEKLQILHEEVAGRLTGTDPAAPAVTDPAARKQGSHAVARLIEAGTRGMDLLRYALSYPALTRELFNLVDRDGMKLPGLARAGGPLTDTLGDIKVAVEFEDNPDILGYFAAWVEAGGYGFDEFQQNKSRAAGSSLGISPGVGINTGDRADDNPFSPKKQTANFDIEPSVSTSKTRTSDAITQTMSRFDMWNRSLQWLRVSPNAIITVTLTARNQRDWLDLSKLGTYLGGGKFAVRFRVRNAAELGLSPEKSIDLGIYQPQGIPVGSGTFFPPPPERRPAKTSTDDLVRAAFSLPFMSGGFAAQVDWDGQHFRAGNRNLTPAQLAAEINTRLGQLGPPPPPDLPEDERPAPEPTQLEGPDDAVILIAPSTAVIPPGQSIAPAQALADLLGRPVVAPDSSYVIGRDGSANVVRRPAPDATAFGHGWQQGNWVAFFPT
ncbi:MAG TPA: hypothetical protein VGI74_12530, partial [Streptosporangiaceae bacterium]